MKGRTGNLIACAVALAAIVAFAPGASAQQLQGRVVVAPHASRYGTHGDIYVNKRPSYVPDPGSDNRYFSDTVRPSYPLGPASIAEQGGSDLLPGHRDVWFSGQQDAWSGHP